MVEVGCEQSIRAIDMPLLKPFFCIKTGIRGVLKPVSGIKPVSESSRLNESNQRYLIPSINHEKQKERTTGLEPAVSTLARSRFTN